MKIVRVAEWTVDYGGDEHSGWLPKGAATPLPIPVIRADLALAVLENALGDFTLEWHGPTDEASGDTAHSSVEEAPSAAEQAFGRPADAWSPVHDSARRG